MKTGRATGWPGLESYSAKPRWGFTRQGEAMKTGRTGRSGFTALQGSGLSKRITSGTTASHSLSNSLLNLDSFLSRLPAAQPPPPSLNSQFSIVNSQLRRSRDPYGQGCARKVFSHRRPRQFRDTSLPCLPSMTRNLQSSGGIILSDFPEEGIFLPLGSPLQNTRNSVAKSSKTHRKLATIRRSPHANLGSAAETCDKPLASIAFLAETSCNRSLFA